MAQGSSNPTADIRKIGGTVVDVNTGSASAGTQRVVLSTDQTPIPVNSTQATFTLSGVSISGTTGNFTCSYSSYVLTKGATITISGTMGGTGSIAEYPTHSIFKISATNGSTTFTLTLLDGTAITTTTGTPINITYTVNIAQNISNIAQLAGQTISMGTGTRDVGTQRVTIATDDVVPISDNSGSLTVDAPVGTPVYVRLSDGTSAIATLPVSLASVPSHPVTNAGTFVVQVDGAALTALQLIDDSISTVGSAVVAKGVQITGTDGTNARVIATNSTGHVKIEDGGNTITVDNGGTFAVQAAQSGSWSVTATQATPANLQVTATPAAGTIATRWYSQITDGTNTMPTGDAAGRGIYHRVTDGTNTAAVKAASTAAVAADPALVVSLSPNSSIPSGSNAIGKLASNDGVDIGDVTINNATLAVTQSGSWTIATTTTQATTSLSGVSITGTGGEFATSASILSIGQTITISGTLGGTGSITGYSSPKTYKISTTNGSTTFTLVNLDGSAIVTTAGTPTGLTYTTNTANEITNISRMAGQNISMGTGVRDAGTQRVTIATNDVVPISDNSGSLTVDAPVSTPVFVRLSDGTSAIATLPVSLASVPSHPVTNTGTFVVQVDGSALTSLQLLDDVVATTGSAALTKGYHIAGTDGTNARIISTNTSGHINIADGNNSITVDAPVSTPVFVRLSDGTNAIATLPVSLAALPGTVQTDIAAIKTAVEVIDNAIAGTEMQVDIVASLPAGTNNIGKVELAPTATGSLTNATTTAYAASLIVKNAAGTLHMLSGHNSKTTAQFIQVHNSTTLPTDTSIPVIMFLVPPSSNFSFDFGVYGRAFSTGITVCNSSTGPTKTIGSADCWFDVQYK